MRKCSIVITIIGLCISIQANAGWPCALSWSKYSSKKIIASIGDFSFNLGHCQPESESNVKIVVKSIDEVVMRITKACEEVKPAQMIEAFAKKIAEKGDNCPTLKSYAKDQLARLAVRFIEGALQEITNTGKPSSLVRAETLKAEINEVMFDQAVTAAFEGIKRVEDKVLMEALKNRFKKLDEPSNAGSAH